jgi:hypothetical protein
MWQPSVELSKGSDLCNFKQISLAHFLWLLENGHLFISPNSGNCTIAGHLGVLQSIGQREEGKRGGREPFDLFRPGCAAHQDFGFRARRSAGMQMHSTLVQAGRVAD